jgi:3-hydroxyacyl-CoA dehydrogenase
LIDIGDGVACLEFHSKMNSIGGDTVQMLNFAIDEVEKNHVGLVVGNQGGNFSAGANIMLLLLAAQEEEWDDINMMIRQLQNAVMRLRYSAKPVVTAPYGLDSGRRLRDCDARQQSPRGGRNLYRLGRSRSRFDSGGRRHEEMTMRAMDAAKNTPDADPLAFLKKTFETIAMGKVATSAQEAKSGSSCAIRRFR